MVEPKYRILKVAILKQIEDGTWQDGKLIPPQREMEKLYNVSRITVRKAVAELIAEGVLEHKEGKKGIFVKDTAVNTSRTGYIAVALDDVTGYFDSNVLKGIEDSLSSQNYHTIVCNANRNMEKIENYFNSFDFSKIDGVIYLPVIDTDYIERNKKILELFQRNNTPYVLIDQYIPGIRTNCVISDHRDSAYELCKTLIDNGHKKILIGGGLSCFSVNERLAGVQEAFESNGIPLPEELIIRPNDSLLRPGSIPDSEELERVEEMIKSAGEFTAIYAINNRIMKAIILAMLNLEYDISKIQLALHNPVNKPVHPYTDNISHVHTPFHEMGFEAANLLLKVMEEGGRKNYQITINSKIILENRKPL